MIATTDALTQKYLSVLSRYLEGAEESALEKAYELGRAALSQGLMHLVAAHHDALQGALSSTLPGDDVARIVRAASIVMMESMAVVEMSLRGYQESNSRLKDEIAEHRKTQHKLQEAREQAEAASRAKSEFLANMSHEIRTPMNAIIGMTDLVLDTELADFQREYLAMVQESAESLLSLINDILDFSKIEAGRLDLEPIPFALRERIGDALKPLAFRAHGKGLELVGRIRPDVPENLVGDPGRLRQVIVNLVGNAIKFTEHGEVVLDVRCESHADGAAALHFVVSDTGIGIPGEKQPALFHAFEQADASTTRKYGGTGLGLAISRRLVQLMGGVIWVESEAGRGSRFHFTARFPLATTTESPLGPQREVLRGVRVLVVDDNGASRAALEELVGSWGMSSAVAADAQTAIEMLRESARAKQPIRLVLADANMPAADGFALREWICGDEALRDVGVILLASVGPTDDLKRCRDAGVAAHVIKPVKPSELLGAVGLSLGRLAFEEHDTTTAKNVPRLAPLRILLAEDSVMNQKLAVGLLRKHHHTVSVANTGKEAVRLWEAGGIDVVLMDVQMPDMDGLEATAVIRAREAKAGQRVPIIAMTAHAMTGDREQCLAAGMDDYVSKPIRAEQLLITLARVLRSDR